MTPPKHDIHSMDLRSLRSYVLANRQDVEALRFYMERLRTEPQVRRLRGTSGEHELKRLEDSIRGQIPL